MLYGPADLARSFVPSVLHQGKQLHEIGAVQLIGPKNRENTLFGLIRPWRGGTVQAIARIAVRRAGVVVSGECTCPLRRDCEHVAAVLWAGLGDQVSGAKLAPALRTGSDPFGQDHVRREDDALVDAWLARLDRIVRGPDDALVRSSREHLIYLLDARMWPGILSGMIGQVSIQALVAVEKLDGTYGRTRPLSYRGVDANKAFVTRDDRRLVLSILAAAQERRSSDFHASVDLNAHMAAEVLELAITTRRCHWKGKDAPPLRRGDTRSAHVEWIVDEEGAQRARLVTDVDGLVLLHADPFWYVSSADQTCGPLETDLDVATITTLLEAPRLAPESAARVHREIADRFSERRLPRPAVMTVETQARPLRPAARLRLSMSSEQAPWRGAPPLIEPQADLTFLYGDVEVSAFDERSVIQRAAEGKVIRFRRDERFERAALERLEAIGIVAFDEPANSISGIAAAGGRMRGLLIEADEPAALVGLSLCDVPALRAEGWQVELDESYPFRVVEGEVDWYAGVTERPASHWFDLELGIEVEGARHSLLPILLEMVQDPHGKLTPDQIAAIEDDAVFPVRLRDGRFVALPGARVRAILGTLTELFDTPPGRRPDVLTLSDWSASRLAELDEALSAQAPLRWSGGEALRELGGKLRDFRGIREVDVPVGFRGTLRPYQRKGLDWLQFLRTHGLSGILADDMGLGKTIQVLAHFLVEKRSGRMDRPNLVVAPTSLMPNWRVEAERFAPDLRVLVLHGLGRKQRFGELREHDVVFTTYPLLHRDVEILEAEEFHLLVLDEAQFVKNARSKAAEVAQKLRARHRLCLTGTPMENHLGELWSLFHVLMPGLLGDEKTFRKLFRNPIEKHGSLARREQLATRIRPFLLRRTKDQVAADLPPKSEITQVVELHAAQRDLYESIRLALHEKVRKEVARRGLARSTIIILDALLKLRQVCCDPRLLKIKEAANVKESAKLDTLLDLLTELMTEGRRVLLFSQFTSMLALIVPELRSREIPFVVLTGDTRDRETPVNRFQSGEIPVFLISLKAGGTGLNLPAADTVIHYDPWWNPAVEDQATDRAHRIGQDKPVFVYRLITAGSVEEKMLELQARKRTLARSIYGADVADPAATLTKEDLDVLFQPLAGTP